MKQSIQLNWLENMAFSTEINGHEIILDTDESNGGNNRGPRPKALLMVSLAGCTAMDVVSILKKMRVDVHKFDVRVDGDVTDEHPKQFTKMHVIYELTGKDLPIDKVQHAVNLTQDKYCGVIATLKKGIEITHEIVLHNEE